MLGIIIAGILSQFMEMDLKERVRRFLLILIIGTSVYVGLSLLAMGTGEEGIVSAIPLVSSIVAFLPVGMWMLRSLR